jgi:hypothetical protein
VDGDELGAAEKTLALLKRSLNDQSFFVGQYSKGFMLWQGRNASASA